MSEVTPPTSPSDARDPWLAGAAVVALAVVFFYRIGPSVVDLDIWHQMALVREAALRGHLPVKDHFAYTPTTSPAFHYEWGAGAIALIVGSAFGGPGIVVLRYALAVGLAVLVTLAARLRGATSLGVAGLAPIAILLIDHGFSTVRAQMYSFVLFAALLCFLEVDRRGRRWWIGAWLPLFVLWINVHPGFVVGGGILAVYWLEQVVRRRSHWHLVAVGITMVALVSLTPYGLDNYGYLIRSLTMERPIIAEWWPLLRATAPAYLFLFGLSLGLVGYAAVARGPRHCEGLALLLVTAVAAVLASRLLFFYAIAWLATVPSWLRGSPLARRLAALPGRRRSLLWGACSVVVVGFSALLLPLRPWQLTVPGAPVAGWGPHVFYPVGAVAYLKDQGFAGNVLVPFDWGAFVSWRLHPRVKVSLDSRYEVAYPNHVVLEHQRFYLGQGDWRALLDRYATDVVLVPNFLPVARRMPEAEGWTKVYADAQFSLYGRPGLALPVELRPEQAPHGRFP